MSNKTEELEFDPITRIMLQLVNNENLKDKTIPECMDMIINDLKGLMAMSVPTRVVLSRFLIEVEIKRQQVEAKNEPKSKLIIPGSF